MAQILIYLDIHLVFKHSISPATWWNYLLLITKVFGVLWIGLENVTLIFAKREGCKGIPSPTLHRVQWPAASIVDKHS